MGGGEEKNEAGSATEPERVCMTVRAAASGSKDEEEEEEEEREEGEAVVEVVGEEEEVAVVDRCFSLLFCLFPRRDSDTASVPTSIIWLSAPSSPSSSECDDSEEEDEEEDEEELSCCSRASETAAASRRRFSFLEAFSAAFSAAFKASGPPSETSSRSLARSGVGTGDSDVAKGRADEAWDILAGEPERRRGVCSRAEGSIRRAAGPASERGRDAPDAAWVVDRSAEIISDVCRSR